MNRKLVLVPLLLAAEFGAFKQGVRQAHAQLEAIGMLYEMQMAPAVCKWTGIGSTKKIDDTVSMQEKALGITPAEKVSLMKAAEAKLKADPTNCSADGMLRPMFDEANK